MLGRGKMTCKPTVKCDLSVKELSFIRDGGKKLSVYGGFRKKLYMIGVSCMGKGFLYI